MLAIHSVYFSIVEYGFIYRNIGRDTDVLYNQVMKNGRKGTEDGFGRMV